MTRRRLLGLIPAIALAPRVVEGSAPTSEAFGGLGIGDHVMINGSEHVIVRVVPERQELVRNAVESIRWALLS